MVPRHGGAYNPDQHTEDTPPGLHRNGSGFVPNAMELPNISQNLREQPQHHQHQRVTMSYGKPDESAGQSMYGDGRTEMDASLLQRSTEALSYAGNGGIQAEQFRDRKASALDGHDHIFHSDNKWKMTFPHAYKEPAWDYLNDKQHRHRDGLTREFSGIPDDRYISPWNGRIKKLVVQATDELYKGAGQTTYRRTFIRTAAPTMMKVARWPIAHNRSSDMQPNNYWRVAIKMPLTVLLLSVYLMFPGTNNRARNAGLYDPFLYRFYGYAKASRNRFENVANNLQAQSTTGLGEPSCNPVSERILRPRYLCFLDEDNMATPTLVDDWVLTHPGVPLRYVVVGYTAEQFSHDSANDMKVLHGLAKRAAIDAGVRAYWTAASCMRNEGELEQDVYRISDVIRGAHSLVIAVAPGARNLQQTHQMLQQWGDRMWTYPEVLLSPGDSIAVYYSDGSAPQSIQKNQFAGLVFSDSGMSRQLLDHYLGNTVLSRLELVSLALQCLYARNTGGYLPGDRAYALMGLLRLHPRIDRTDTSFQAFARLSLANDSDRLLERLICLLPRQDPERYWEFSDAWSANLWDVFPTCQVAGIGPGDTVIIDGLRGASIRWKSFTNVASITRSTWSRWWRQVCWHSSPAFFWLGIVLLAMSGTYGQGYAAGGAILFIYSLIIIVLSPWVLPRLYQGKFWWSQPSFFGFEGHLNIGTIERQIFGSDYGRLQWSPHSSALSRHAPNKHEECVGLDPINDPETAASIEQAQYAKPGDMRVFTLVDTGSMQVTLFQARRPPVALLLAGEEGGMQRAIGVSYEWETATCYRETVLRLATPSAGKMSRVNRLRLGLSRKKPDIRSRQGV